MARSKARQIIAKIGGAQNFFEMSDVELCQRLTIKPSMLRKMDRKAALLEAKASWKDNYDTGAKMTFLSDADYPRRLKQCEDAPLMLFQKGKFDLNNSRMLAIVGTRKPTNYGMHVAETLVKSAKGSGITIVSGLAYGIDVWVHKLCLKYNVPTLAVLGHGLDRIYPYAHRQVAQDMLKKGGLLTEFVTGTNPDRENFPKRNRIVAGLCDATLVIESKRKGGSLITAELANDYNRDVFAVPGQLGHEMSEGCNWLIANDKAHLYSASGINDENDGVGF